MSKFTLLFSALLLASTAACSAPETDDSSERLRGSDPKADSIEFWGACGDGCGGPSEYGNCWCDETCEINGDCCDDVLDTCDIELGPWIEFYSFKYVLEGGKPSPDNFSSIEVRGDGTMIVDKMFDPSNTLYTVQLSYPDFLDIRSVFLDSGLMEDMYNDACPRSTSSLFERMRIETSEGAPHEVTSNCQVPSVKATRIALQQLAQKYVP